MLRGDRLRELRTKHNYTHEKLSELLSVGISMIARYETGTTDPTADVVGRIADVFDVSADYLLGRTDDASPCYQPKDLNENEQQILAALRRGDALEAIKRIVSD